MATTNAIMVGGGDYSHHTACCEWGARWREIYVNSNTDLRREEKLENSDANPTFHEQHDCKYSLSRQKRQADYMHHVETFTNSIKWFQALFLEVFLHYKVFHQRNVHFIGHLRTTLSQIPPPLALPPQNILPHFPWTYLPGFSFIFWGSWLQLSTTEQPKLPLNALIFFPPLGIRKFKQ